MGYLLFYGKRFNFRFGLVIPNTSFAMLPYASQKQHWFEEGINPVLKASYIILNVQNKLAANPVSSLQVPFHWQFVAERAGSDF